MYLLTNVITMLMIPMQQALHLFSFHVQHAQFIPRGSINEYTYELEHIPSQYGSA